MRPRARRRLGYPAGSRPRWAVNELLRTGTCLRARRARPWSSAFVQAVGQRDVNRVQRRIGQQGVVGVRRTLGSCSSCRTCARPGRCRRAAHRHDFLPHPVRWAGFLISALGAILAAVERPDSSTYGLRRFGSTGVWRSALVRCCRSTGQPGPGRRCMLACTAEADDVPKPRPKIAWSAVSVGVGRCSERRWAEMLTASPRRATRHCRPCRARGQLLGAPRQRSTATGLGVGRPGMR